MWTRLLHSVTALPLGGRPIAVYTDSLADGWRMDGHIRRTFIAPNTSETVASSDIQLNPRDANQAYQGDAALAVVTGYIGPIGGPESDIWQLNFHASEPVRHYRSLRFAFHSGTSTPPRSFPAYYIFVNDRHYSAVSRSADPLAAFISQTVILDGDSPQWHVLEVPLNYPGLGPIESFGLVFTWTGTFYLDEIELLPADRPADTAVRETHENCPLFAHPGAEFPQPVQ